VLIALHHAKQPGPGQIENTSSENLSLFDPRCCLCPTNGQAGSIKNPDHKKTFLDNDFAALLLKIARTNQAQFDLQKGCYGARMTGAGFGGCTVSLVKRDHADEFVRTLGKAYQDKCVYQADIYICTASDGAKLL